jgi:hypothetical protein
MSEYLKHHHENGTNKYPDQQGEIAANLKNQNETMKNDIAEIEKLARIYYGSAKSTDYTKHIPQK